MAAWVRSGAGSRPARGAKPRPRCGRESSTSGYGGRAERSRDLALRQVQDLAVDLLEPVGGEGAPIGALDVSQHPFLAVGVDEVVAPLGLVVLDPLDEPQPDVDRLDQGSVVVGDLLAQLANSGVAAGVDAPEPTLG